MSDTITLLASKSHLYRGARLRPLGDAELPKEPTAVSIMFGDGTEVSDVELLKSVDDGAFAIAVPSYRTAAGTDLPAKLWRIKRASLDDGREFIVGERFRGAFEQD